MAVRGEATQSGKGDKLSVDRMARPGRVARVKKVRRVV